MDLNDEEIDAVYSHAELYVKIIFDGLKAGNADSALERVAERILNEVPAEYQKEVVIAINKHINYRDMLLHMLDIMLNLLDILLRHNLIHFFRLHI